MTAKTHKRATSADVAREAGVARSTVSYVVNDTPHQTIPEATRKRVLDAATRLGYRPSAAARTLKRGRSDVVLCIQPPWPLGPAAGALLAELTTAFDERGLTLVIRIEGTGAGGADEVWNEISPAAVVSYRPATPDTEQAMRSAGIGSVVVLFSDENAGAAQLVRPDNHIGRLQAEHLIGAGHVGIGYAYPAPPAVGDFARPRLEGVGAACADAGLAAPDVRTVTMDAASAAASIRHWLSLPQPVTGVCAYNDDVAQALLAGARLAGVAVPGTLAVIGADDIPTAALTSPPLTTISIDHAAEARRIVESVTATLAGQASPETPDTGELFAIVVRESA